MVGDETQSQYPKTAVGSVDLRNFLSKRFLHLQESFGVMMTVPDTNRRKRHLPLQNSVDVTMTINIIAVLACRSHWLHPVSIRGADPQSSLVYLYMSPKRLKVFHTACVAWQLGHMFVQHLCDESMR